MTPANALLIASHATADWISAEARWPDANKDFTTVIACGACHLRLKSFLLLQLAQWGTRPSIWKLPGVMADAS